MNIDVIVNNSRVVEEPSRNKSIEHFRAKWILVRVKKMRLNKDLERFHESVKFGNALDIR